MRIPDKFKEYAWLVNTIHRARRITMNEINNKWLATDMSEGVGFANATFHRHKAAIQSIFGIIVECDRSTNEYYIANPQVLREDSIQNWLLSTLSVSNIISESLSLQDRILLQPVPYEGEHLKMVIEAMKKNVKIEVDYQKYEAATPRHLVFEPYCIKLFKQRWYILGHFHHEATASKPELDYFGMFSLDRIINMSITNQKFRLPRDFDAKEYFANSFGVLVDDGSVVERIVLRAYDNERHYLHDLPLHKSQREIGHGDNYTDFELFMRPSIDFSAHILSRATQLEVLSPEWLAIEIHNMHLESALMYEPEEEGEPEETEK